MASETKTAPGPLEGALAENFVRVIETAISVQRRYQFFAWSQSSVQAILPHHLLICGAYRRARKVVQLEVFNSIFIPDEVLSVLANGQSPLMQRVVGAWVDNLGKPLAFDVEALVGRNLEESRDALVSVGFGELLIHGVSRPQRISEVESLFILASPGRRSTERQRLYLDLLAPHLHSTYLRVQSVELEMNDSISLAPRGGPVRSTITERERQILGWVREGMNNQQIGAELNISPLTVKNHVQKILRKLGASNRAQAVARAMTLNLLGSAMSDR